MGGTLSFKRWGGGGCCWHQLRCDDLGWRNNCQCHIGHPCGWSYDDVLPYFRRMESYAGGGADRYRGREGPLRVTDPKPATPLLQAARTGDAATVRALLDGGADMARAVREGETPLMAAARTGSLDAVKLLLARGADINAVEGLQSETALMWAIAQHHPETVKVLLAHKADVNIRTDVWTQLWQTAPDQDVHPDYQSNIKYGGDTAILFAARYGDLESAKMLVAAGANVNDESAYGANTAVLAAHSGNPELLQFLLDKDANPNANKAGYAAIHAAILRGDVKAVEVLLNHGADPKETQKRHTRQQPPPHMPAQPEHQRRNHPQVARVSEAERGVRGCPPGRGARRGAHQQGTRRPGAAPSATAARRLRWHTHRCRCHRPFGRGLTWPTHAPPTECACTTKRSAGRARLLC
mgnify:CR=1 FL=1